MRRTVVFLSLLPLLLAVSTGVAAARQNSKDDAQVGSSTQTGSAALEVCLRTDDGSAFAGSSNVRMIASDGHQIAGALSGADGEVIFAHVLPGTYTVEASAPGFVTVLQKTQIESDNRHKTLFLIMEPRPQAAPAAETSVPVVRASARGNSDQPLWARPGVDETVPTVEAGVECPLSSVIGGAGRRIKDLIENLQKFDATEHVEHSALDATGPRGRPEVRTFDYVAIIKVGAHGVFELEEYRNGSVDPAQFPAGIATLGLPGMAFVLHPAMVSDFNISCEGLGQWDGHATWLVHFAQRPDQPNRISGYVIDHHSHPVPLKGRVWIDAGTFQIRHFESELMVPIHELALTQERMAIDYGPVHFRTHAQQLWLPLHAEIYWEVRRRRIYRRHSFSNFKIFEVESAQQIQSPRGSYCFTNTGDRDIAGILTVLPASSTSAKPVSVRFTTPSGRRVCKLVGSGKDVDIPADQIGAATFRHDGLAESITADVNLAGESTLDLIAESEVSTSTP